MKIHDLPEGLEIVCARHRLPMLAYMDRDAYGCGHGCEITGTMIAAGERLAQESEQNAWRREHGIPRKE